MQIGQPQIAVILPVYRNTALTHACIVQCLPNIQALSARLFLINDQSPEPGMQRMLEAITAEAPETITLMHNEHNLGFTASVNLGLSQCRSLDVVLLNSDVLVPRRWLEKLIVEAYQSEVIGTVTPLSNNSTISSLPSPYDDDNSYMLNLDVEQINESLAGHLPTVSAPTGIGFCMYIKASCLARVGHFNVEKFGHGYGEENDFCQRAIRHGFINVLTPNLYCHHVGNVSFGASAKTRMSDAALTIAQLHPSYHKDVAMWVDKNPLAISRTIRNIQISRSIGTPIVLFVIHNFGGGTVQHLEAILNQLGNKIFPVILKGKRKANDSYKLGFGWSHCKSIDTVALKTAEQVIEIMTAIRVDSIHVHHLTGISHTLVQWIQDHYQDQYLITCHDFYFINGNPTLTDQRGEYFGVNAKKSWHDINAVKPQPFAEQTWRQDAFRFLKKSKLVLFPSFSTQSLYQTAFSSLPNSRVIWHEEFLKEPTSSQHYYQPLNQISILILGAIGKEKGADFLEKLAKTAHKKHERKYIFKLIGYSYRKLRFVQEVGPYDNKDLNRMILEAGANYILFTSRCPETFSYTLSAAISSNIPIIAPNIGVFPERLQSYPHHILYELATSPEDLLSQLDEFACRPNNSEYALKLNSFYESSYLEQIKSSTSTNLNSKENALSLYKLLGAAEQVRRQPKDRSLLKKILIAIYNTKPVGQIAQFVPLQWIKQIKRFIIDRPS